MAMPITPAVRSTSGRRRRLGSTSTTADVAMAGGRPPLKAIAKTPLLARHISREFLGTMRFFVGHGLLRPKGVKELSAFDDGRLLAVPGAPRVVHVPGHTAGSSALLLEARGVLFTGDALVTHDVYSGRRGPRLLARVSNADTDQAMESLAALSPLRARILLPGHGDPWQGSPADAVAAARERGRRVSPRPLADHWLAWPAVALALAVAVLAGARARRTASAERRVDVLVAAFAVLLAGLPRAGRRHGRVL